jgi:hypothetical protein
MSTMEVTVSRKMSAATIRLASRKPIVADRLDGVDSERRKKVINLWKRGTAGVGR